MMKTSICSATLITAIAIAGVCAAPVEVAPITEPTSINSVETKILAFRLGHAAGLGRVQEYSITTNLPALKPGCKFSLSKIQRLTEGLRHIFGFAPIFRPVSGAHIAGPVPHDGAVPSGEAPPFVPPGVSFSPPHPMISHFRNVQNHRAPFMARLEYAIKSLGVWEARAVAFVLGCGLGALLRILFMFCLIAIRALRKRSQRPVELNEDTAVLFAAGEAMPSSEPPAYGDEKVTWCEMFADDLPDTPFSEEGVKSVTTIGMNAATNGLSVYWTSITDELHETPIDEFKQFAPKALLSFYEANLKWKEVSE